MNYYGKQTYVGYRFNYHGENTASAFSFPTKHDDLKSKKIRFVEDWQPNLTLFVVYISHFEVKLFKRL